MVENGGSAAAEISTDSKTHAMVQELEVLWLREIQLHHRVTFLTMVVMGLLVIAGLLMGVARAQAPQFVLASIHIPDAALAYFGYPVMGDDGNAWMDSLHAWLFPLLPSTAYLLAVIGIASGLLWVLFEGLEGLGKLMLIGSAVPIVLVAGLRFVSYPLTLQAIEDQHLIANRLEARETVLSPAGTPKTPVPELIRDYVLAQASILQEGPLVWPQELDSLAKELLVERVRRIDTAISRGTDIQFDPRVLLVLETKVFGEAQSAPAEAYQRTMEAQREAIMYCAAWVGVPAIILFGVAGLLVYAASLMRKRIGQLLAQLAAVDTSTEVET